MSRLSFRRAQLILLLISLVAAGMVFLALKGTLDGPVFSLVQKLAADYLDMTLTSPRPLYLSFLFVWLFAFWAIVTFLSPTKDAVEWVQGMFSSKEEREAAAARAYDFQAPQHLRNRQNVIFNVRSSWIENVLEKGLGETARLELELAYEPAALTRPMQFWKGQAAGREISPDTTIQELFDKSGRAMLILGAPGSGKTFTLLELCRDLLREAEQDTGAAVPVVLNLSTWAEKRPPLAEWTVERMWWEYGLARPVSRAWLEQEQFCLLLDGLDEVQESARGACVEAINQFKAQHAAGLVVCSRTDDYRMLAERLHVTQAIAIQPLTADKITAYLLHPRLQLKGVYEAVQQDDALGELSRTPLMLSVMALAYQGVTLAKLRPLLQDENGRRRHLYNAYIRRAFRERSLLREKYSTKQALGWLRFVAHNLMQRAQTQFFIEGLQPDWLPAGHKSYGWFSALLYGPIIGLSVGCITGAFFRPVVGLVSGIVFTLVVVLALGLLNRSPEGMIEPVDRLILEGPILPGLAFAALPALCIFVNFLFYGFDGGILVGLTLILILALLFWVLGSMTPKRITK